MQFFTLAVAAIASASAVYAVPAKQGQDPQSGACNGYSCNYALQNLPCTQGTSCASADGGGDGKRCDVYNFGNGQAYAICPGKAS
ncbi:hypothetical protein PG993_011717 [Apiospora rasikravindrae]|uniref:Uncharacterized protein n=1 Tax=Apiospora rasikravindrae TaxID=990691 RepID=A0ABR1S0E5_9PEZI